jgi:ubiquinone/menaquinone biosynthesis C-methylase UbiE
MTEQEEGEHVMTEAMAEHHFDTTLPAYERWGQPCSETFSRAALDGAALRPGAAILDVCAGMGALAVPAVEQGYSVRAIDIAAGMVRRANERLKPYPAGSAEVMDALNLQYGENEFDAAFSVFGVVYFGSGMAKALTEMARVVRPGGLICLVNWAVPMGAPFFIPLARAIDRMDDPEAGKFVAPLTEYLEGSELERALSDVGCVDTRSEAIDGVFAIPNAETFMDELDSIFQIFPQYRAVVAKDRDRFRKILAEEVLLIAAGPLPPARGNIAYARVPTR